MWTQNCTDVLLKAKPCPVEPVKLERGIDKIYTNEHLKRQLSKRHKQFFVGNINLRKDQCLHFLPIYENEVKIGLIQRPSSCFGDVI